MELDELVAALPERPVRAYAALVSTEAEALAWARAGAPDGAVVLAAHQLAPRGRGGFVWQVDPARDVAFSLVLRPRLPPDQDGWLYAVAVSGLADVVDGAIAWPDELRQGGARAGAVAVQPGPALEWAVVNVLAVAPASPRPSFVAQAVAAIERRSREPRTRVLADYLRRCETIGRRVEARLVPLGPAGRRVRGRAVTAQTDGALVLETDEGRRLVIPPHALGILEDDPSAE